MTRPEAASAADADGPPVPAAPAADADGPPAAPGPDRKGSDAVDTAMAAVAAAARDLEQLAGVDVDSHPERYRTVHALLHSALEDTKPTGAGRPPGRAPAAADRSALRPAGSADGMHSAL